MIRFTVLNARTCKIIRNADVEIWHCDAIGDYSGVNGAATRFLRGHQRSNAKGVAEFLTVFPGWYRGRTPHIHMKVSVGGNEVHTGPDLLQRGRHAAPCTARRRTRAAGVYDTPHAQDMIYQQAGGSKAELKLKRRTGGLKGYVGTIAIGVVT